MPEARNAEYSWPAQVVAGRVELARRNEQLTAHVKALLGTVETLLSVAKEATTEAEKARAEAERMYRELWAPRLTLPPAQPIATGPLAGI